LPKAQLDIRIYFDGLNTARDNVIRTLFDKMLTEKLREFAYLAQMADLDSEFSISSYYTMNISVKGFRDSFDRFINSYLEQIL
jgi:secreted Zn-dependent insulinase-like peptidase